jgi:hypothetical protein
VKVTIGIVFPYHAAFAALEHRGAFATFAVPQPTEWQHIGN